LDLPIEVGKTDFLCAQNDIVNHCVPMSIAYKDKHVKLTLGTTLHLTNVGLAIHEFHKFPAFKSTLTLHLQLSEPTKTKKFVAIIAAVITGFALLLLFFAFLIWRKVRRSNEGQ
jgi:hypothetical protein